MESLGKQTAIMILRFVPMFAVLIVECGLLIPAVRGDDLETWIRVLETPGPPAERAATLVQLRKIAQEPRAAVAIPALTGLLKDADAKVREEAVATLGSLLYLQKRPCPLTLVETLGDPDPAVRMAASTYVGVFEKYPEGALPVFKRAAANPDRQIRECAPHMLKIAGAKDPEAIRLIEGLTRDPDPIVANNAEVALWHATKDVDRFVAFGLKIIAGYRPVDQDAAEGDRQAQTLLNQRAINFHRLLKEQLQTEPERTSQAFIKACGHPSAEVRRAAARTIGGLSQENVETRNRLRSEGVEGALRDLSDDPDEQVRQEVQAALPALVKE